MYRVIPFNKYKYYFLICINILLKNLTGKTTVNISLNAEWPQRNRLISCGHKQIENTNKILQLAQKPKYGRWRNALRREL